MQWKEYDPYTGVTTILVANDDDDFITVHKEQDVQPTLDLATEARNTKATDQGIKNDMWLYCKIPVTVQHELLKKGINVFNKDHTAKVLEEINANYPKLKMTNKHHSLSARPSSKKLQSSVKEETSTQPGPFVIVR
jgi:hypothetical protein